jgi:hypothetical protein
MTDENVSRLTTIWGKIGFGADIPINDKLYVRPMFLYGIGTNSKDQKDYKDALMKHYYFRGNGDKYVNGIINHGFDIKVAVGYKF